MFPMNEQASKCILRNWKECPKSLRARDFGHSLQFRRMHLEISYDRKPSGVVTISDSLGVCHQAMKRDAICLNGYNTAQTLFRPNSPLAQRLHHKIFCDDPDQRHSGYFVCAGVPFMQEARQLSCLATTLCTEDLVTIRYI